MLPDALKIRPLRADAGLFLPGAARWDLFRLSFFFFFP